MTRCGLAVWFACGLGTLVSCDGATTVTLRATGPRWLEPVVAGPTGIAVTCSASTASGAARDLLDGRVDFAVGDEFLDEDGARALPIAARGIAVVFHVDGVEQLQLSRDALAGIWLGEVRNWRDPKIRADNVDSNLPDARIRVFHRADPCATNEVFTAFLASISAGWRADPGVGRDPEWIVSEGGRGGAGMIAAVTATPNAIGFVEYDVARDSGLSIAAVQNRASRFVGPTPTSLAAALTTVEPDHLPGRAVIDAPGDDAYPMVAFAWLWVANATDAARRRALATIAEWCLTDGQARFAEQGLAVLPAAIRDSARATVAAMRAVDAGSG